MSLKPLQHSASAELSAGVNSAVASSNRGGSAARLRDPRPYLELCLRADTVVALGALLTVFLLFNVHREPRGFQDFLEMRLTVKNVLVLGVFAGLWRLLFTWFGAYNWRKVRRRDVEALRILTACAAGSTAALLFPLTSTGGGFPLISLVCFGVAVSIATIAVRNAARPLLAPNSNAVTRVLIVGTGPRAQQLRRDLLDGQHEIAGFVDSTMALTDAIASGPLLGSLDELEGILMRSDIDEVVVALPIRSQYMEIQRVIQTCERMGVHTKYLADVFRHTRYSPRFEMSERVQLIAMPMVTEDVRLLAKRGIDLTVAVTALCLLSPVLLLVLLAIKLTSPGPVLFAQIRYGFNRRRFRMYKFRTMVWNAESRQAEVEQLNEATGPIFKIRSDPRMTTVGRFLRRTSLDELPQLLNVLRGEMSLVGPRPLPLRDVERFEEASLMRRFSVMPGMTGLWQVSGRRNLQFDSLITQDLRYIDQWSLALDLRILARTPWAVVRGQPGD
jgi:exopolysaccharide biosynthesis polyprenyl glycosylphosphotransferase